MSGRSAKAAEMAQQAQAAREQLAIAQFDVNTVLMAVEQTSANGRTWLRLRQSQKVELAQTKAARRLVRRLAELGYRVEWQVVMPLVGEDQEQRYHELVITWGREENPALHGSDDSDE